MTVRRARRPAPAPAASPRLRRSPSPWPPRRRNQPAPELTPPLNRGHALHPGPYPPDLSRWNSYGALTTDFSRAPSRLACRTRTVWQYRHVPSLSGLLALTGASRLRLPSAPAGPLRRPGGGVLSPPHGHEAPRGARFPRSAHTRYGRSGRPLCPGTCGALTSRGLFPARRLPPFLGTGPIPPAPPSSIRSCHLRGICQGFTSFARPAFPSPVAPG